jgi:hypothetical protein
LIPRRVITCGTGSYPDMSEVAATSTAKVKDAKQVGPRIHSFLQTLVGLFTFGMFLIDVIVDWLWCV